jgi:hypothetical protein
MSFFHVNTDFLIEVGKENVPGHRIEVVTGLHEANVETAQLGDLSPIPSVVTIPVPGGIQLEVVSDSAQDGVAGTGVLTLEIHYLDSTFAEAVEIVTMNGTTPVNTVATDIQEIQYMHTKTAGSSGKAVGNISIKDTSGVTTYDYILAGFNQTFTARWTVPLAKKAYLLNWHCSGLKKRIDFHVRASCDKFDRTLLAGIFLDQDMEVCEVSNSGLLDGKGLQFPAQSTIKMSCIADAVGGEASGGFTVLVVDD